MVEKIDIDDIDDEESAEANKPISLDFQVWTQGGMFFPILQVFIRALLITMLGHNNLNQGARNQEAPSITFNNNYGKTWLCVC